VADRPEISVIIPVLNEADRINNLIDHLEKSNPRQPFEIIVVDGDPAASTLRAIQREGPIMLTSGRGRAKQMNLGAAMAKGGILLFLHADTEMPPNALRKIITAMGGGTYVAGAFDLGIKSDRLIFRFIERVASVRSRITGIPFGDQAIFIRKDFFETIGGYKDIPLMEDVKLMRQIKVRGGEIFIIPEKVRTSARRWEEEGILSCMVRNWALQTLYAVGVSPYVLARFYRNH
jgi:rSAM/selenodomain-associated transferase 2